MESEQLTIEQPTFFVRRALKKSRRREKKPLDEGGGLESLAAGASKPFSFRDAMLNSGSPNNPMEVDWGMEDIELREDNLRKGIVDGVPSIEFWDRINTIIEESMFMTVVVKLFGRKIGYNTLWNKVCALWKSMMRFQLMDVENDYYLAKFESKVDYNNPLSNDPWVISGII